jgi:hypothetical protein
MAVTNIILENKFIKWLLPDLSIRNKPEAAQKDDTVIYCSVSTPEE